VPPFELPFLGDDVFVFVEDIGVFFFIFFPLNDKARLAYNKLN
jgi:hypothetical protein